MSNNKQSSIELFIEQLEEKGGAWENVSIRRLNISIDVSEYMELKTKAKAMHKEEIENAQMDMFIHLNELPYSLQYLEKRQIAEDFANQYYNETFGGNNEQQ